MRRRIGFRFLAIALSMSLGFQLLPIVALGDSVDTSTDAASTTAPTADTTSSASSTAQTSTSATSSDTTIDATSTDSSTTTAMSSESASTTIDDLSITASSSAPVVLATSTDSSETVFQTASSSTPSGFATTSDSISSATTTPEVASSTDPLAATSTDAAATSTTSDDATSTASSTVPSVASSTQTVVTGDSASFANILNILNATFLNSTGAILFANFVNQAGTIDLRDPSDLSGLCDGSPCAGLDGISLNLLLDASIANDILISAKTGSNAIQDASSSAAIQTGDAMAGLNLINLANVNFAGSKYLLVTLNAFKGVNGDIIFPSLFNFFNSLSNAVAPTSLNIAQDATVSNNVGVGAGSGSNTTNNVDGATEIQSGTTTARANIFNDVNGLSVGNGLSILLRVGPNWNGQIFGLPDGVSFERTSDGIYIFGNPGGGSGVSTIAVAGTTTAAIGNRVQVQALTGDNRIADASSTALIVSGNAFAGANIINIANQTVIGRNWLLAVLNIFGNFAGDISFGRPDLWVADKASAPAQLANGSVIQYEITLKNKGDAVAHGITLHESIDRSHVTIAGASLPYTESSDGLTIDGGTMNPGETKVISYSATVHDATPNTAISNTTSVTETEPDNNSIDNVDHATVTTAPLIVAIGSGSGGGSSTSSGNATAGGGSGGTSNSSATSTAETAGSSTQDLAPAQNASLTVHRETQSATASPTSSTVTEIVTLANDSTEAANGIVLHDVLRDSSGTIVHSEEWDIGTLTAGDAVQIQYDFNFASDTPSGTYTLTTEISGDNVDTATYPNGTIVFTGMMLPLTTGFTPPPLQHLQPAQRPHAAVTATLTPIEPGVPDTGSAQRPEALVAAASVAAERGQGGMIPRFAFAGLIMLAGFLYSNRKKYI